MGSSIAKHMGMKKQYHGKLLRNARSGYSDPSAFTNRGIFVSCTEAYSSKPRARNIMDNILHPRLSEVFAAAMSSKVNAEMMKRMAEEIRYSVMLKNVGILSSAATEKRGPRL